MKVFVTGVTGVMGRSVTDALHSAGHSVVGLARRPDRIGVLQEMDVEAVPGSLFEHASLLEAFDGCDVVCNLATHVPVGRAAGLKPGAWKANDRIRAEGSRIVAAAAREAGVGRLVQESVSFLYADRGENWIDEDSPVAVTRAAEPVVVAEANAEAFAGRSRHAVVLRFGNIIGDDAWTRWRLARAGSGHPVGMGSPESWTHVVHPDDVGSAVVAALAAPSGTYNVGAEPIRRRDLVGAFAEAAGHGRGNFHRRVVLRLGGERVEWMTRSQRVSSARFATRAGWKPYQSRFDPSWLKPLVAAGRD